MFYILTSDATHSNTVDYFSEHAFFGLQRSQIFFFQQASMPCLTTDGEAIIQDDGSVRSILSVFSDSLEIGSMSFSHLLGHTSRSPSECVASETRSMRFWCPNVPKS